MIILLFYRVNLTFRMKSAHKLKLTDKQLLQWLFPILLVMMVYLSAWTLSDPPQVSSITQNISTNPGELGENCFILGVDGGKGEGDFW